MLHTARELKSPSPDSLREFSNKREELAAKVSRAMAARSDIEKLVGPDGLQLAEDNNRNFPLFMESVMSHYEAEVLVDTALWAFRAYRSHGFQITFWPANTRAWIEALRSELTEASFHEIAPFYEWILTNVPAFTELSDSIAESGQQEKPN